MLAWSAESAKESPNGSWRPSWQPQSCYIVDIEGVTAFNRWGPFREQADDAKKASQPFYAAER